MTTIFNKFQILGTKIFFPENLALSCTTSKKLMIQFQENTQTEGQTERWMKGCTEGRTDPTL